MLMPLFSPCLEGVASVLSARGTRGLNIAWPIVIDHVFNP